MILTKVPSVPQLEELILQQLAVVLGEDPDSLRSELLAKSPSMPADSYQLLEVILRLETVLSVDLDTTKFEGYLKSVRRAAHKLHEVLRATRRRIA